MQQGSFSDLFTMDENRHLHRTILAYVNQMFQQISGINLITYYAATIYQNGIGLDPFTSRILAAANGTGESTNLPAGLRQKANFGYRVLHGFLDCGFHNREVW